MGVCLPKVKVVVVEKVVLDLYEGCPRVSSLMAPQRPFITPRSTNNNFGTACKTVNQNGFQFKRGSKSKEMSNKRNEIYLRFRQQN